MAARYQEIPAVDTTKRKINTQTIIFIYKLLIVLRIRRSQITDHLRTRETDGEEIVSKKN